MATDTRESALVVLVPEAESFAADYRLRFDPVSAMGVPAHVTVLYPFKPPPAITSDVLGDLADLFASLPAFDTAFREVRRFPEVVYLAPEPAQPFLQMTEAVVRRFPEHPPYGGRFVEIVPHLTLAHLVDAAELAAVAAHVTEAAAARLPIAVRVKTVTLIESDGAHWRARAQFPLAA